MRNLLIALSFLIIPTVVFAAQAKSVIKGTSADSKISGNAALTEENNGVSLEVNVENVPPGKHGFHIHEKGSCDDKGKAAGSHFNPENTPHGYMPQNGMMHAHAGDFGNIDVGADGKGTLKLFLPGLTIQEGKYSVAGKALILHEKEDDLVGQPAGNAGERIGCGVIIAEK